MSSLPLKTNWSLMLGAFTFTVFPGPAIWIFCAILRFEWFVSLLVRLWQFLSKLMQLAAILYPGQIWIFLSLPPGTFTRHWVLINFQFFYSLDQPTLGSNFFLVRKMDRGKLLEIFYVKFPFSDMGDSSNNSFANLIDSCLDIGLNPKRLSKAINFKCSPGTPSESGSGGVRLIWSSSSSHSTQVSFLIAIPSSFC